MDVPPAPWSWGPFSLFDANDVAIDLKRDTAARAMTCAAPEMLALLREAAATDKHESPTMHAAGYHYDGEWMEKVRALLARLPKESP